MTERKTGSVTDVFQQLRLGDRKASEQLWMRFFPRLLALARKTLASHPQRVSDADDAVQSAFVSFWQRAERGDFSGDLDRDGLWRLLATITVRKAKKQAARERAQKRGGGRVRNEADLERQLGAGRGLDGLLADCPAPEFDLVCEEWLLLLDDRVRAFALLRLMGYANREIAEILDCTERTVERKLALIRQIWEPEMQ